MENKKRQYEIRIKKREGEFKMDLWKEGTLVVAGDFVTLKYMQRKVLGHVKRVSKTQYKDLKTGDIKNYAVLTESERMRNKKINLGNTFEDLRAIIRANFQCEGTNQLFITLTYAQNMQSQTRLLQDFMKFYKRLKYAIPEHDFEYVAVMEPQGRGAWHVHLMLKSTNHGILYIDNRETSKIWGHGFTTTDRLKSDDLGNYYTAYFTGLIGGASSDEDDNKSEDVYKNEREMTGMELSKARIKGARLCMYPAGFRLYRCSRGIERPKKIKDMVYGIENDSNYKKQYSTTYDIEKYHFEKTAGAEAGEVERLNTIHKATYRKINAGSKSYGEVIQKPMGELTEDNVVVRAKKQIYQYEQCGLGV